MSVTGVWNTTKWNGCVWDTATHTLSCAVGSYSYLGIPASLSRSHVLACATGSYTYTGLAATLNVKHTLLCNVGTYAYTGQAATLTYVSSTAYTLFCDHGGYLYSGIAAKLGYVITNTKQGGDDAPRSVKNLKYKPRLRKDDFGNEIVVPEVISALTVEKYTLKPTRVNANELQSHLEIDDEEAILMFI